jgi:hypothetical protein
MNSTSDQSMTNYEQHHLDMLLWQAQVHERNGQKQEASKIRDWVDDFLRSQSEFNEQPDGVFTSDSERNQEQSERLRLQP